MAGMFYSLQEVAEKLNKTEEEVKEMVKEGKLREFRDGPNLLFKVDEVEVLMDDTSIMASKEFPATSEHQTDEDEISLVPEPTERPATGGELTNADTAIAGEGINALGETDNNYQMADDTMDETKVASGEASLEEIEEDVNLDTFGSGSGLLDLSLQADDTSLGGILDEIYTPEGDEAQESSGAGSATEIVAEAEQMLPELAVPQAAPEAAAIVQAYVKPKLDTLSNAFGIMLFLPLLAIIYMAIVVVAGFSGVMPAILEKIQDINGPYDIHIVWYIMGGFAVAAISIVGVAFILSGKGSKAAKKQKAKKAKQTPQPAPESDTKGI